MTFRSPLTLKRMKAPPPGETGQESIYLKTIGEKQTQVSVKLLTGEVFKGWIEYFDSNMIRLTREGAPNLFIYKHEILYISEDGRGGRHNG
jgi:host factor-I protein